MTSAYVLLVATLLALAQLTLQLPLQELADVNNGVEARGYDIVKQGFGRNDFYSGTSVTALSALVPQQTTLANLDIDMWPLNHPIPHHPYAHHSPRDLSADAGTNEWAPSQPHPHPSREITADAGSEKWAPPPFHWPPRSEESTAGSDTIDLFWSPPPPRWPPRDTNPSATTTTSPLIIHERFDQTLSTS